MKIYKILNNTAAVVAALAIASCAELEEKPESSMVSQQFYNTEADAVAAVNAVYADLNPSGQSIYNSLFQIGVEMATDDYMAGPRAETPMCVPFRRSFTTPLTTVCRNYGDRVTR